MESLKALLLECQLLIKEEKWEEAISKLKSLSEEHFKNLTLEEAKECLNLLNFLIQQTEEKKLQIAQTMVNINRLKGNIF